MNPPVAARIAVAALSGLKVARGDKKCDRTDILAKLEAFKPATPEEISELPPPRLAVPFAEGDGKRDGPCDPPTYMRDPISQRIDRNKSGMCGGFRAVSAPL